MVRSQRNLALNAIAFSLTAAPTFAAADEPRPTYAKDVAAILDSHCVACHRPGEVAPMSLQSYEEVRPWVKSIQKRALVERSMPPWHADPAYGHFGNDRRLSESELTTLSRWIDQGAPEGNPAERPEPPVFVDGWYLGQPDYILEFDEVTIDAEGPDRFENLSAQMNLGEDKWIRAIEIRPADKRAVHHTFAYVSEDGEKIGGKIGSYSIAGGPAVFPDGAGRRVLKDQLIVASVHYHPFGTATTDRLRIGLYWADGPIKQESVALAVQNTTFTIPAGAKDYEVRASHTFDCDAQLTTLGPHMHQRGKDFAISAVFPDGREQMLLLTHWNPDWNIKYELAEPLAIPAGTRLDLVARFDNSAENPNNPDPTDDLTFGVEEMMIGFIDYLVDVDSE